MIGNNFTFFQEWKAKMKALAEEEKAMIEKINDKSKVTEIPKQEEIKDDFKDVIESIFECVICFRPMICSSDREVKMCGKPSCK